MEAAAAVAEAATIDRSVVKDLLLGCPGSTTRLGLSTVHRNMPTIYLLALEKK